MAVVRSPEKMINELINGFGRKLPKFDDGRINYTGSEEAAVVNVVVKRVGHILILKRGDKVANYKGRWNGVAGFLDEPVPIKEKVLEELEEETGITESDIKSITINEPYKLTDESICRTWYVCPVLVEVKPGCRIRLDWEHTEYKWILPEQVSEYETVMGFERSMNTALRKGG